MHNKYLAIFFLSLFTIGSAQAQFRKIPGEVTDAFKQQYPNAAKASWSDKVSYFAVDFMLDSGKYDAQYTIKGVWKLTYHDITADKLPSAVKDGYDKSKYTDDWKVTSYTAIYMPGNIIKYRLVVRKSGIQKKNLYFNASGKLLDESSTL